MEILRIFHIWCLFCLCFCQEGNESVTDNDLTDSSISVSTNLWISSSLSDEEDTSTSPATDIIITRPKDDISNVTVTDTSESDTTVTNLSTPDEEEENISGCEMNPCKNGGLCLEDPSDSSVFDCMCPDDFTGTQCGVKDNCRSDEGIVCKKGYCSYSEDRSMRSCNCFFGMYWDDIKEECKNSEPPCFPNPCHNGGECNIDKDSDFKCECPIGYEGSTCSIKNNCGDGDDCPGGRCERIEENNLKICTCSEGKYWNEEERRCEDEKLPCTPNPCKNHGLCEILPFGDHSCNCSGHYLDKDCKQENTCYNTHGNDTECGNKGTCKFKEISSYCDCIDGYYWDAEMRTCRKNFPPCYPNPCANDGLCSRSNHTFHCKCSEEYTGVRCENPDYCVLQGGNVVCGNVSCVSNSKLKAFQCQCEEGFYFDFGKRTCLEIDFCPIMMCGVNEQCVNSKCICQDNFQRNNNTNKCEANYCAVNPCPIDDMICTEGQGIRDFYCSCKEGYSFNGAHCANAVCVFPSFNDCDQKCRLSEEEFNCKCDSEFFILNEDNNTCTYTGNSTCSNKTCDMGKCFKGDNDEETCACPPGYTEEEGKCIDLCKANKVPEGICPDNQCESTKNGFRCKCEGKYQLSKDKVTCTIRRTCQKDAIGWKACSAKNATCIEDWNSDLGYACQCTFPQKESNQGICQDVCSNEEYQRKCSALGATCDINAYGEIICKCPPLYQQTKNEEFCNKPADVSYLITIPLDLESYRIGHTRQVKRGRSLDTDYSVDYFQIQYDAEEAFSKIFPELIQLNVLNCRKNGNSYLCKIELQFISITEEDLKRIRLPDFCVSGENSVDKCLIPPSLISKKDRLKSDLSIRKSDPCDMDFKEQICGSETVCTSSDSNKSFNCTCGAGYEMRTKVFPFADSNSFIETCNDVNECLMDGICPKHTTCENLIGSYSCSCTPGYRIKDKTSDPKVNGCVEICNPNPCDHGSCERNGEADFVCRCEAGFAGILCDLTDANYKRAQTNTIIVGAVLGGALLVLIIIFFVTVQRIKKKKLDEPDRMLYATEMTERRGGAVNNAYQ
ncbi:neurogenic locus notch homolog protein 2 isoform X3 [Parasteatoda tepidariorum]|uniref:neurogenic locus notch homolog protein 2 isoform X1 n=1 Tax=Parasteatoda tepidariorum TaxID=114398 RepID=UPI0039BD4976